MNRSNSGAAGGKPRQPRATRAEMSRRRKLVLSKLESGPKEIDEIFDGTDLTYAQSIGLLKMLESRGDIQKVGKNGREIIYAKSFNNYLIEPSTIFDEIHMGDSPRIVGMRELDHGIQIELRFPSGKIVPAQVA
jgi:hypothetical protein